MKILQICIPIYYENILKRENEIEALFLSLLSSLNSTKIKNNLSIKITVIINGSLISKSQYNDFSSKLCSILLQNVKVNIDILNIQIAGKISAINFLIEKLNSPTGLVILDDDIILPKEFIDVVLKFLSAKSNEIEFFCFYKVCVTHSLKTKFLKEISFFFNPVVQRYLMKQFTNYRVKPTGSCYLIPNKFIVPLPNPCNESEYIIDKNYEQTYLHVWTKYPTNISEEISRRKIHIQTNKSSPLIKTEAKSESFFNLQIQMKMLIQNRINTKILNSLNLLTKIITLSKD